MNGGRCQEGNAVTVDRRLYSFFPKKTFPFSLLFPVKSHIFAEKTGDVPNGKQMIFQSTDRL
jgi:hypothetical protein